MRKKNKDANNHYNCPMVISYSEVIKNNMEDLKENNINFINPFISLNNKKKLIKDCMKNLDTLTLI